MSGILRMSDSIIIQRLRQLKQNIKNPINELVKEDYGYDFLQIFWHEEREKKIQKNRTLF